MTIYIRQHLIYLRNFPRFQDLFDQISHEKLNSCQTYKLSNWNISQKWQDHMD